MRRHLSLAFALACLALALALATTGPAQAFEAGRLTIWIAQGQDFPGMEALAQGFTAETGVEVLVARPEDAGTRFPHMVAAGAGPDIVIAPHEPIGAWFRDGLLAPVVVSPAFKQQIEGFAWQALTLGDKTYGYPLTLEAVALIYNKALLPEPPKRFEDIAALERDFKKRGKHALVWDYATPQFTYPLLAANGGYTFKRRDDGSYDPADNGIANPGARLGAQYLRGLIDQGALPKGLDYTAAETAFGSGEAAMTINGPWAWANIERRGIDYGIAPLPSLNGKPPRPCVSLVAAAISAASPNQDLAARFLERHLLTAAGLRTAAGKRPPAAAALKDYQKELGQDPRRAATFASARGGDPIPPIPEMAAYWTALEGAITALTSGKLGLDQALDAAAARLPKPGPTGR